MGAGAIGCFLAARLAEGVARVSMLARGRTLAAIRANGVVLESGGRRLAARVEAAADAAELGAQDIVFVTVKAPAVAQVAQQVRALCGPATLVVPALNGIPWWFPLSGGAGGAGGKRARCVDPEGAIARAIPPASTVGAVIYAACSCPEPGVCRHASGSRVVLGEIHGGTSDRVGSLVDLLGRAGHDAEQSADIRAEVWMKLLGNACFNPVSLLTGAHTDEMIDDAPLRQLMEAMIAEVLAVGASIGIALSIRPGERIATASKLGHIKTSMLQDAEAGRPVELEAILGAVIEIAQDAGVPAPACAAVYTLARARARVLGLLPPAWRISTNTESWPQPRRGSDA